MRAAAHCRTAANGGPGCLRKRGARNCWQVSSGATPATNLVFACEEKSRRPPPADPIPGANSLGCAVHLIDTTSRKVNTPPNRKAFGTGEAVDVRADPTQAPQRDTQPGFIAPTLYPRRRP